MKILTTPLRRRLALAAAIVLSLGSGYAGLRHWAWPAWKAQRIDRMNAEAAAYLQAGDLPNALLMARRSLQSSRLNPAAWRLAAETATARGSAEAVGYQESLCQMEPTRANRMELLRLSLRFNALANAERAVAGLATEAADEAEFHELAGETSRRMGKGPAALRHLAELARLRPGDGAAQLELAAQELAADRDRRNPTVRPRLAALAAKPELRARAWVLLLREGLAAGRADDVRAAVHGLGTVPDLSGGQRLDLTEGLLFVGDPAAAAAVAGLQAATFESGPEAAAVIRMLTRRGRTTEAAEWAATLPEPARSHEETRAAAAEALLNRQDWPALVRHLRTGPWPTREYLRQALLARAARAEGREVEFAEAWKLALIAGGADAPRAFALLSCTEAWGWKPERHDVVVKLFALLPANPQVRAAVLGWERARGNTANLHRIFTRLVETDPDDTTARNNLAYTGLLLDSNLAAAGLSAATMSAAEPANPYFATTHALALYKQGRAAAALARIEALSPAEQATPERMLLRGLFAAYAGDAAKGRDLIAGTVLRDLLPEERALAGQARAEIARLEARQGNSVRLQRRRAEGGADREGAADTGWLALADAETRAAATTDQQLADSLYAAGDWAALAQLVRGGNWRQAEYLRFALSAYAARRINEPARSQESWRQAMALADRVPARVRNLERLAGAWAWAPERLATLNALFERDPGDRVLLEALLGHYRATKRTAELIRVLTAYVTQVPEAGADAAALAYYSLLRELGAARAHVAARNAYMAKPPAAGSRLVYAFSLWKQGRTAEAAALVADDEAATSDSAVPLALLRAAILADSGAVAEARRQLGNFDPAPALPEEVALAQRIERSLSAAGN